MTHQEFDKRVDEILDRIVSQEAITEGGYAEYTTDAEAIKYGNPLHNKHELRQAIRELFEEDAEQKQSKIMALVCAENGGEFSISRKTYEEYDDNCVLERLDSPLMDSVVYRLRTTITGKQSGE